MSKPGESYAQIKPLLRTFDLLLFKGSDVVSKVIAKIEKIEDGPRAPDFTHVGCVVLGKDLFPLTRDAEKEWLHEDTVYVFESTMSGKLGGGPNDVTDHARFGVQLRSLDDVVESYDLPETTRMAWAPLRQEVRERVDVKKARDVYEKYKGLRYDASIVDLAAAIDVPCTRCLRDWGVFRFLRDYICCCFCWSSKRADYSPGTKKTDNLVSKWQFCSELVANIYKDIGIVPVSVNTKDVIPTDMLVDPEHPEKTFDADKQMPPVCMQFVRFHKN